MTEGKNKTALTGIAVIAISAWIAVAVALAGCDGAADVADEVDSGDADLTVVKLGIAVPLTQGAVVLGQGIENGAVLAIDDMAKELAALGVKVEPFSVDDQSDARMGVNVANQLVSDPNVIGVVGHLNSGVSIPASEVYNKAGIVMVSPASTNPQLTLQGYENVFRTCTVDPVQGAFAGQAASVELGFETALVVDDSTPYGEGLADEFVSGFEAAGGTVIDRDKTSDADTAFGALVTKIAAQDPDVVYYGGIYNAGALLAKQVSEGGYDGPLLSGDGICTSDYIDIAGAENAEGDLCTLIGLLPDMQPGSAEFREKFSAMFPGEAIQAYDMYAYDAAYVVLYAVKTVAEEHDADFLATPDGKAAIIEAVAVTDLEGATGRVSFDENGDTTNEAVTLYVVADGSWVPYE